MFFIIGELIWISNQSTQETPDPSFYSCFFNEPRTFQLKFFNNDDDFL